jgi:predicted ATP-dependent endonuclease of OLD family
MLLRSPHVENFEGIQSGALEFDEKTLLIGENDAGRTSLLYALSMLLKPPTGGESFALEQRHFHRPPAPVSWKRLRRSAL